MQSLSRDYKYHPVYMATYKALRAKQNASFRKIASQAIATKETNKKQRPENSYKVTASYLRQFERYAWRAHVARFASEKHAPRIVSAIYSEYLTYVLKKEAQKLPAYTLQRWMHQYKRKETHHTQSQVLAYHTIMESERIRNMRKQRAVLVMPNGYVMLRTA